MNTKKKTLSVVWPSEYADTVKYYLSPDKKMRGKINAILRSFRDYDLCRIEDSERCNEFKRDILAIVLKCHRNFVYSCEHYDYYPWEIDDSAMSCACKIEHYIDETYNYGEV